MEVYGVYAGEGIREGIRGIRLWRYTQMEIQVVYAGRCIRGIHL